MATDILVLSVGFTGILVAEALARHRDRSKFSFAVAGRSQQKLDAVVARPLLQGIETYRVDISNEDELNHLVSGFKVVINCTSRYWDLGIPVVRACASAGTHYLDLTGELPFYLKSVSLFDSTGEGKAAPSIIIHACGYESIPSDIATFESIQKLREEYGPNLKMSTSTTATDLQKAFVSRGTAVSGIYMLRNVPRNLFLKSVESFSLSPIQGVTRPRKLLYDMKPHDSLVGSFFMLAANNVAAVNRTWGLLQTNNSSIAYGEEFAYSEFLVAPSAAAARITSVVALAIVGLLIYVPPFRWLAGWLVDRDSTNPKYSELDAGRLSVTNITSSAPSKEDPVSHCAKTVFKTIAGDGGYLGSAISVTECALLLVLYPRSELPLSSHTTSRVLTPATAFGSELTKRLLDSGFYEITTEILT
ncbi:Saccharopine dehydrogenase-domain-containing protein [Mycena vitilis]|nr:Saccharopine dehydrogenase-domain-containing protein [Mycena vitilis]